MLQEVMTSPGVIEFRDVPIPEIRDDQVLVKMMRLGICGSDIHVYHGKHPFTKYPVTQVHEVSGEIVRVGSAVTGGSNGEPLTVGQKVTIQPQVVCGKCHPCRHGKYNLCEELKVMGFQTTGTASHYFAVDAGKVIEGKTVKIYAKAGAAGKLFGSVTSKEIAEAMEKQLAVKVDKKKITLDTDIKAYGTYKTEVRLHPEVKAAFFVAVVEE